jgi:hypothetical protein
MWQGFEMFIAVLLFFIFLPPWLFLYDTILKGLAWFLLLQAAGRNSSCFSSADCVVWGCEL